ncbi:MAG: MFS transporter [Actinomycetota bacterium]|nr:MFS transporter [Actinomycetota bacterium]
MTSKPPVLGSRFRRLLAAHATSQLGIGLHLAAFPLLVSTLTTDPRVVAGLALISSIPGLFLALPIGSWVDRAHRGRLMVGSDLVCAGVLMTLTTLVGLHRIEMWMLFTSAAAVGIAELVFGASTFALLPSLVRPADLTRANSYLSVAGQTGSGVIGPALGGLAFAAVPFLPFAVNGATYLISSAAINSFARRTDTRAAKSIVPHSDSWRRELVAGIGYLSRHRPARTLLILSASSGLFGWMPEATFVLFARKELRLPPTAFGVLLGATTVGAVIGGLVAGRAALRLGTFRLLVLTYSMYGLLLIPVGLTTNGWIAGALFFLQGLPLIACDATTRSLLQTLVPDELLGRIGAVNRMVHSATVPLGLAAGGILATWVGLRAVWIIAGLGYLGMLALNIPALKRMSTDLAGRQPR